MATSTRTGLVSYSGLGGRGFVIASGEQVPVPKGDGKAGHVWFGFDSIPVLTKDEAEVQQYFLTAPDAIAKLWLKAGAAGWRLDVSGDASFPSGYREVTRPVIQYVKSLRTDVTKQVKPDSLSISETWQKDSTLLRSIRGDRLDSTMTTGCGTPSSACSPHSPSTRRVSPTAAARSLRPSSATASPLCARTTRTPPTTAS